LKKPAAEWNISGLIIPAGGGSGVWGMKSPKKLGVWGGAPLA